MTIQLLYNDVGKNAVLVRVWAVFWGVNFGCEKWWL